MASALRQILSTASNTPMRYIPLDKRPQDQMEALDRLERLCAYRDRCEQELRQRLKEWAIQGEEADQIIESLADNDFLSEKRFAQSYCRGKFRYKRWGRNKILRELKSRNLSQRNIDLGMAEIVEEEYLANLEHLLFKKWARTKAKDLFAKQSKVGRFLINKGYESDLVWKRVRDYDLEMKKA